MQNRTKRPDFHSGEETHCGFDPRRQYKLIIQMIRAWRMSSSSQ